MSKALLAQFALFALAATAMPQQSAVIPASALSRDAGSMCWIAGTTAPHRQLTLIDGSLLDVLLNHTLAGISFRRDAADETFAGGSATLTIRLSHAARAWSDASATFAANHGNDVTTVFQGLVTLPTSPPAPGPSVAWTAQNCVSIAFQTPFAYRGGTLALEVTGAPDPAAPTTWWPVDAVWEQSNGTAQSVGTGCGPYGGTDGLWSLATGANFVPGGTASFHALGAPGNLACWLLAGSARANAVDLATFGSPGCFGHVEYLLGSVLTLFELPPLPWQPSLGGLAMVDLPIPSTSTLLGASLASQWLSLGAGGLASSNAHRWTVATSLPSIPMTIVSAPVVAGPPATGRVILGCGNVMRFDWQ